MKSKQDKNSLYDDLLYRSACRMKRLIELDAPKKYVLSEATMIVRYAIDKYMFRKDYDVHCVEIANHRKSKIEEELF